MASTDHADGDRYRRELYAAAESDRPYAETRSRVLELGVEYLGADGGYVAVLDEHASEFVVTASAGAALLPGRLGTDAFHAPAVDADAPVASDVPADEAPEAVRSYVAGQWTAGENTVGVVGFVSTRPGLDVTASQRAFVDLASVVLGRKYRSRADRRGVSGRRRRHQYVAVLNQVFRHNVRNDINVIHGLSELLADELDGENASRAGRVANRARRLDGLSEKAATLDDAVHGRISRTPTDPVAVVDEVVTDLGPEGVRVDAPASAPAVAGEPLRYALRELVENALQHGATPVTVTVRVRPDGERVRVRVADEGPGLSTAQRRTLTDSDGPSVQHGGGLGLYLVNWVTTTADGTVSVDGTDWSEVTLELPTVDDEG